MPSKCEENVSATSAPNPSLPVGFFDDCVADAKARGVDVHQLAEKQLEADWEAFQEFAAEVEEQAVNEEKQQAEEALERKAVEQLDNMQYLDKYREALENATKFRNGERAKTGKRKPNATNDVVEGDEVAEGASAVEVIMNEYKKKHKKAKQQRMDEKVDDFDPNDWRSRGI